MVAVVVGVHKDLFLDEWKHTCWTYMEQQVALDSGNEVQGWCCRIFC